MQDTSDRKRCGAARSWSVAVACLVLITTGEVRAMEITSTAFEPQQAIPAVYTCDGADVSPPLAWIEVPNGVQSFALIADDPDAPGKTWVHWVVWNIPAQTRELPERVNPTAALPDGTRQGTTDFGRVGYGGPCPPSGTHRYFFKLFALDTMLELPAGTRKYGLLQAMEGHVLDQAELVGTYQRQR